MIVIHLSRKPLGEPSVAANVVQHGMGGLNVDRCRIGNGEILTGGGGKLWSHYRDGTEDRAEPKVNPGLGRWPANLILEHRKQCQQIGVKRVKPFGGSGVTGPGAHGFQTQYVGGERKATGFTGTYVEADGFETVEAWDCCLDCPIVDLDLQSGVSTAGGGPIRQNGSSWKCYQTGVYERICDTGGASRFFKQIGGAGAKVRPHTSRKKQVQDGSE